MDGGPSASLDARRVGRSGCCVESIRRVASCVRRSGRRLDVHRPDGLRVVAPAQSAPHHHRTDGRSERVHLTLHSLLCSLAPRRPQHPRRDRPLVAFNPSRSEGMGKHHHSAAAVAGGWFSGGRDRLQRGRPVHGCRWYLRRHAEFEPLRYGWTGHLDRPAVGAEHGSGHLGKDGRPRAHRGADSRRGRHWPCDLERRLGVRNSGHRACNRRLRSDHRSSCRCLSPVRSPVAGGSQSVRRPGRS